MKQKRFKILTFPIRLALVILIFGALFKVMHWPYASILMLIGGVLIGVLYTIRFFAKKEKVQLDYVKVAFVLLWLFSYLVEVFHLFSVPYIFQISLLILFVWWFINEGVFYFKKRSFKNKGIVKVIYFIILSMGLFSLFFGALFKIQHWPFGSLLFTVGILTSCILLIIDYFMVE